LMIFKSASLILHLDLSVLRVSLALNSNNLLWVTS
jgi:hypothetical protein